jgi:hypothetical protein
LHYPKDFLDTLYLHSCLEFALHDVLERQQPSDCRMVSRSFVSFCIVVIQAESAPTSGFERKTLTMTHIRKVFADRTCLLRTAFSVPNRIVDMGNCAIFFCQSFQSFPKSNVSVMRLSNLRDSGLQLEKRLSSGQTGIREWSNF